MAPKATPPSGPPTPQTKGKPAPRLSAHSASSQLLGLPRTEAYLPSHRETHERANYKPWGTQMPTWAGKDGTRGGPSKWNQWWQPAPPPPRGDTQESPTDMLRVTKRIPHARSWAPAGPGCHTNPGTQCTHTPRRSSAGRKGGPSPRERMAETAGGRPLQKTE